MLNVEKRLQVLAVSVLCAHYALCGKCLSNTEIPPKCAVPLQQFRQSVTSEIQPHA